MTISEQIENLTEGDRVFVTTSHEWLTEKEYIVSEVCPDEYHHRAEDTFYRVYVDGVQGSKNVIHRDPVSWSTRRSKPTEPELFYIDDDSSAAGYDERTEGQVVELGVRRK